MANLNNSGRSSNPHWLDYILMTELWHCPPTLFEQQPDEMVWLHSQIYVAQRNAQRIEGKREDLRARLLNG